MEEKEQQNEISIAVFGERLNSIDRTLEKILEQTTRTNGRVNELEKDNIVGKIKWKTLWWVVGLLGTIIFAIKGWIITKLL